MSMEQISYRTLLVSSSAKFVEGIKPMLSAFSCESSFADSASAARRMTLENDFDFIIINSPLPDGTGLKFAAEISTRSNTVCLFFTRSDNYSEVLHLLTPSGVFVMQKPSSAPAITQALSFMAAARARLLNAKKETRSLEDKMKEIRLVNRAKWFLIEHENMSEAEAHRQIERQSMNRCVTRTIIANEIIEKYG